MFTHLTALPRQYVIAGGVVAVLIVLNIVGFWFVRSGLPPDSFAGRVAAVSDAALTVVDAKGHSRSFTITASTTIVTGKDVADGTALATSTFVMVTTDIPGPVGSIAKKIRILSTDPFTRLHKGATP